MSMRFKSRDESKPELVDSWLGVKIESGPKQSHSHIGADTVFELIWPKIHGGDEAEIEPMPEKNLSKAGDDSHSGYE